MLIYKDSDDIDEKDAFEYATGCLLVGFGLMCLIGFLSYVLIILVM